MSDKLTRSMTGHSFFNTNVLSAGTVTSCFKSPLSLEMYDLESPEKDDIFFKKEIMQSKGFFGLYVIRNNKNCMGGQTKSVD